MGCGICGAFPFIAGLTTTMANMGIIYTSSPVFIILISILFFKEKISFSRILGLLLCLIGVFIVISKGNFNFFINFKFTSGDLWMTGAALGWALYSIYLINWKSTFSLMARFTLIAMFGCLSLFPFFLLEGLFFAKTNLNLSFLLWVLFAAISPSIIAFSLYSKLQKYLGASLTGFTLYLFAIYGSIFGIIIFEESLMPFHYLGATFVFTGVYLAKKLKEMKTTVIIIFSIIFVYLIIISYMYLNQRKLMYLPSENNYLDDKISFEYEEIFIPVDEKINLRSWFIKKNPNNKTLLFFTVMQEIYQIELTS